MEPDNRPNIFDTLILVLVVAMVVAAPLAMGSVAPWAANALHVGSLAAAALWIMQMAVKGRLRLPRDPLVLVPILLFLGILFLQLLPLAPDTLRALSPATAEIYEKTLPGYPASGEARTLSITPYNTEWGIRTFLTFVVVFLVVAHTVRTRSRATILIVALIAIGAFEAIYGLAERFSGRNHIFWNERIYMKEAVTGTFVNKNHFAGFLEMIIPLALGLFISIRHKGVRGGSFRARTLEAIRAPDLNRQVILAVPIILMVVAVLFSLSRAGTTCAIGSWIAFSLFIGLTAGIRSYTLSLLFLLLLVLCISVSMGSDIVIERMEDAASSESISWTGRFDLWDGGLRMIGDFPLTGTGFGTFEEAFERYQSSRFGDRYADYLHNDLLQVFCETGIAGGLVALGGLALLMFSLARKTLRRHDTFCRWTATGAMLGCGAMLLHSVFDFNLYKITSNGLVFSVLLGLWYAAVHMPGKNRKSHHHPPVATIPIRPAALRWALLPASLLLLFFAVEPIRAARADVHLNRYLASPATTLDPHYYHFLPLGEVTLAEAAEHLDRAVSLDGDAPHILYRRGVDRINAAGLLVRTKAREQALSILADIGAADDLAALEELTDSLFPSVLIDMAAERGPYMRKASELVREASRRMPSEKRYHLTLAEIACEIELERGLASRESARKSAGDALSPGENEARTALWLCPNKPGILFRTGRILLVNALESGYGLKGSELMAFINRCFRRSIAADPRYAGEIFPLVRGRLGSPEPLVAVTPLTIRGYDLLSDELLAACDWDAALESLDTLTELTTLTEEDAAAREMHPSESITYNEGSAGFDRRDPLGVRISASRRKAQILGIQGRFEERRREEIQGRQLRRLKSGTVLWEVRTLKRELLFHESYSKVRELLEWDWTNPELLVLAAELAATPGEVVKTDNDGPLDHLFRLVIYNGSLRRDTAESAAKILARIRTGSEREKTIARFIAGALDVISGEPAAGVATLEKIDGGTARSGAGWKSAHLVDYYRGLGLEATGRAREAREAYEAVIAALPTHQGTRERLAALGSAPGDPEPDLPIGACFGGKIVLLGCSFGEEGEKRITYFWKFLERMDGSRRPKVHFKGIDGQFLFHDEHEITIPGAGPGVSRPYPVSSPRCGEVIVENRQLASDPRMAAFMTIEIISKKVDRLVTPGGSRTVWISIPGKDG